MLVIVATLNLETSVISSTIKQNKYLLIYMLEQNMSPQILMALDQHMSLCLHPFLLSSKQRKKSCDDNHSIRPQIQSKCIKSFIQLTTEQAALSSASGLSVGGAARSVWIICTTIKIISQIHWNNSFKDIISYLGQRKQVNNRTCWCSLFSAALDLFLIDERWVSDRLKIVGTALGNKFLEFFAPYPNCSRTSQDVSKQSSAKCSLQMNE